MNVVITGSTRGIGFGLAREFLRLGHSVTVSGRTAGAVDAAVERLTAAFPGARLAGVPCDVARYADVEGLWAGAVGALGPVDIWINNAGRDGLKVPFASVPPADYEATVATNLVGLMHCTRVCLDGMGQQGSGWIWNMEGFGSNGAVRASMGIYGCTKAALTYFTRTLEKELAGSPVKIGFLSPGIVLTDMLLPPPGERGERWLQARRIYNIMADTVETVTPFLVDGILRARRNGASVRWLTPGRIAWRFARSLFVKRDLFGEP
jgi:NAD(P)-dependent dehydrogenase (short-subunit alcohol dehydrogenase family)